MFHGYVRELDGGPEAFARCAGIGVVVACLVIGLSWIVWRSGVLS